MKASLVKLPKTDKKTSADQATEFGELAGYKFIKLRHYVGIAKHSRKCTGPQGLDIKVTGTGSARRYVGFPSKHPRTGVDCRSGELVFYPEPLTGILYGQLPDTEFNRNWLATTVKDEWPCSIVDPDVHKEIKQLAKEKGYLDRKSKAVTNAEVVQEQNKEIEELKAQLAKAEKEKKMAEAKADIVTLDAKKQREELREDIKRKVELEYKEIIDDIKKIPNLKAVENSKKYKEVVVPEINKRYEAALKTL